MPALREPRARTRLSNPQQPPPGMTTPSFGAGLTVADAVVSADFGTGHDQVARGDAAGSGSVASTDITDSTSVGRSVLTGTAAQGRTALGAAPLPAFSTFPDGTDTDDRVVIVPSGAHGSTSFTDLAAGRALTASGVSCSRLAPVRWGAVALWDPIALAGAVGKITAPQSDDLVFAGDFTFQALVTLRASGSVQRIAAQGRVEDGAGRWCWGVVADGRLNFAYHNGSTIIDVYSVVAVLPGRLGRPADLVVSRSAGELRIFVDGTQLTVTVGGVPSSSHTTSATIGVPVSGAPAAADALILGARSPASPVELLVDADLHFLRICARALHSAAYDPTA